ncbi:predicted protein [Botrytis cinerea T4]|uniref:Uncharacterized protein n=1 Tax=Botryotinia fuckeliana (strain T4) TaxID=999810 RepID=G2YFH8_BOTF4|nr:predicted protein [Botrytis cinerea T4]
MVEIGIVTVVKASFAIDGDGDGDESHLSLVLADSCRYNLLGSFP